MMESGTKMVDEGNEDVGNLIMINSLVSQADHNGNTMDIFSLDDILRKAMQDSGLRNITVDESQDRDLDFDLDIDDSDTNNNIGLGDDNLSPSVMPLDTEENRIK